MENPISEDELIATCGKVGKILLTSGAETSRVERRWSILARLPTLILAATQRLPLYLWGPTNRAALI